MAYRQTSCNSSVLPVYGTYLPDQLQRQVSSSLGTDLPDWLQHQGFAVYGTYRESDCNTSVLAQ